MGQQTIMQSMNKSYSLDENDIERRFQSNFKLNHLLNQGMLSQTAVISYKESLFVLRAFPKTLIFTEEQQVYKEAFERYSKIRELIIDKSDVLHISPIYDIIESTNTVFTLRQYYYYNLKERMYKLPYLTYTEKLWIIFQLLLAVSELHQRDIIHGDIKLENIMLTSNGSLFLTDIASYKPAYIPKDNSTYYTYYFGSAKQSLKTCNLAPERFVDKKELIGSNIEVYMKPKQPAMDVFSLGCVIAELLLEEYLFDYEKMLEYKNKKVNINQTISKISNNELQELITKMLEIDPSKRITLSECLNIFSQNICPIAIPRALIHFNTLITKTKCWYPDLIIGSVYKHWRQIWKLCYGEFNENNIPKLYNKFNLTYINNLSNKQIFSFLSALFNSPPLKQFEFIFDLDSQCRRLLNEDEYKTNIELFTKNNNDKTAILFMNYIVQNLPFAFFESTKIVGMEMLKCFSHKLTDLEKLQFITPYFKPMLTVKKYLTRLTALHYLIDILQSINFKALIVSPLDYKFFYDYLSPAIFEVVDKSDSMLILEFISELDRIIDLEQKFRDVERRSRLEEIEKRRNATIERVDSSIIGNNKTLHDEMDMNDNDNNNDNDDTTLINNRLKPSFTVNIEQKKNFLEKQEVNKVCDRLVKNFKLRLFSVIQNLFNNQEDIDMLQLLLRKLPILLTYYGSDKEDEIFCFCINILNKKEWILIKEILTVFPVMLDKFDQNKNYRSDLITCIEMILSQNINEHVIYELVQVLISLFATKKKSAPINTFLPLFSQLLPFQIHPNTRIRDDIIAFTLDFISQLNPVEAFVYTYEIFKPFLQCDLTYITKESIQRYLKPHICRTIFELYLDNYECKSSKLLILDMKDKTLLDFLSEAKALSSQMSIPMLMDTDDNNNNNNNINEYGINNETAKMKVDEIMDPDNYCFNIEEYKKYNKKTISKYSTLKTLRKLYSYYREDESGEESIKFFVQKILASCEMAYNMTFPKYTNNTDLLFEEDMGFGSKAFQMFLFVKKFNISIKLSLLDSVLENQKENEQIIKPIQTTHLSYQTSASYATWRPQGQLITTIPKHKNTRIEKVIQLTENSFMSIDSKGNAYSWNISTDDGNIFLIEKGWAVINQDYPITFNSTISNADNNHIVFGSRDKLVQYNQQYTGEGTHEVLIKTNQENNYITATCTFEKLTKGKLSVLFSTVDCKLNIYDPRMEKIALICELPKERGIVSCISRGFNEQTMNIGTLGGYVMKYDARLNSFSSSMKYQNNKPIVGISSYSPSDKNNTKTQILNSNYLIIWSASDEHDIALWDTVSTRSNTITPSVVFRTNVLYPNKRNVDIDLLDIPEMTKVNDFISSKSIETEILFQMKQLDKFSWIKYNNNEYRKFIMQAIQSDFYDRVEQSIGNIEYIYNDISTVQSVCSPYSTMQLKSPYYILSAGNDKTIRYWDLSKEWLCSDYKKKGGVSDSQNIGSYIVNAPCLLKGCRFTKTECDGTFIIRSNEMYYEEERIKERHVSDYQNWNGKMFVRNYEQDEAITSFMRIADAAHQNVISSILPLSISVGGDYSGSGLTASKVNLLVSGSWDGSVKIWK